jgi:uncharacterized protein YkwD
LVRLARVLAVVAVSVGLALGLSAVYGQTLRDPGVAVAPEEQELIDRINAIRAEASCPRVTPNASLAAAARAHADDMVARGYLSTLSPDGEDPVSRARAFGYSGGVTESFAAGLATPAEVASQWTNPANPHAARVNQRIRDCDMVSIGIGHSRGSPLPDIAAHVWVMTLGNR